MIQDWRLARAPLALAFALVATLILPTAASAQTAPTIGVSTFINANANAPLSFTVTAFDNDPGAAVTLTGSVLPAGASFPTPAAAGSVTATFTWTPSLAQLGSHNATFVATDETGRSVSRTVAIHVYTRPTFSQQAEPPVGSCICTPLLMNTLTASTQWWFVRASGGALTIEAEAVSVNSIGSGSVRVRALRPVVPAGYSEAFNVLAQFTSGTAPGQSVSTTGTIAAAGAGEVIWLEVSTPSVSSNQGHFRLNVTGAEALGTTSPSFPSFEHAETKWYFNVGAGETFNVNVLASRTPAASTSVDYTLTDPAGVTTNGTVSATSATPGSITGGAVPGIWSLRVDPSDHYRLEKTSGADRGSYLRWDSAGYGQLTVKISNEDGSPFTTPVTLNLLDENGQQIGSTSVSGSLTMPQLDAGSYSVELAGAPGTIVTAPGPFDLFCDDAKTVEFVLRGDVTPPTLVVPQDAVIEAVNADGAPFSYAVLASDAQDPNVEVVCTHASGSLFPLGATTVSCTATDDSQNSVTESFTVTVQDTTGPQGGCTASVNPSTKHVPAASRQNEDGFYEVSGSDAVSAVSISLGSFSLAPGETVKLTQAPGTFGVMFVGTMGPGGIRHFRVGPGDPVLTFTDGAGNTTQKTCYVAPVPK